MLCDFLVYEGKGPEGEKGSARIYNNSDKAGLRPEVIKPCPDSSSQTRNPAPGVPFSLSVEAGPTAGSIGVAECVKNAVEEKLQEGTEFASMILDE